ncbi:MAG: hypothetical protein A2W26_00785, partial [Acidobacteria bacterium RBG_16_64_8]
MNTELAVTLYRTMVRIRRFEEAVGRWFYRGMIPGFVHLYIGQEAVAAGVSAALREDDCITSTHRGHGHVLGKGADSKRVMAELFGRSTGYCRGKGGSMHVADLDHGILGANGVLAGGVGIATGVGLASKMRHEQRVAVAYLGDAAANQGLFWESLNLSGLWELPVVYVIENNGFGEYTPAEVLTSSVDFEERAAAWGGVAAQAVDGNDVIDVHEAAKRAVARARAGQGPSVLNCRTYRWMGHNQGEEAVIGEWSYRSEEDLAEWKQRDPLPRFQRWAMEAGLLSQSTVEAIRAEAEAEMEAA